MSVSASLIGILFTLSKFRGSGTQGNCRCDLPDIILKRLICILFTLILKELIFLAYLYPSGTLLQIRSAYRQMSLFLGHILVYLALTFKNESVLRL